MPITNAISIEFTTAELKQMDDLWQQRTSY